MSNYKKNKADEKRHLELLIAYRTTFGTPNGKEVLNDLIKSYMLRSSMSTDAQQTAFREGERNVILKILTMLNINEDEIRERVNNVNKT